jgi:hypothetical protein
MKKCYKCQKIYIEPEGPGFQDVCEGCGSYLHCCQNCLFYDPYQHNSCTETQAEFVSDSNGMNRCEYYRFKAEGGSRNNDDDKEGRRFRKPDWRNVGQGTGDKPRRRSGGPFGGGGGNGRGNGRGTGRDSMPSRGGGGDGIGGGGERAKKAREALDKLFRKD